MEEISPDLSIVSVSDYPRHWKTFAQFVLSGIGNAKSNIILYTPETISDEEKNKISQLGILGTFSSVDDEELEKVSGGALLKSDKEWVDEQYDGGRITVITDKELSEQIAELFQRLKTTDLDKVMFDVVTQRTIGLLLKGDIKATIAQTFTGYVGKHKVAKPKDHFHRNPRDGSILLMEELNEGSVCLTNWGPLYDGLNGNVTYTPLLFPQTFLMAMGSVRDTEYAFRNEKGEVDLATKKVLPITLMFDHRIGAFNDVMPFIKKLDEIFQNPEIMREW